MIDIDRDKLLKRIADLESQVRDIDSTIRRGITGKVNLSKSIPEEIKKEILDIIWERK